jgi:hypothetical protein
VKEGSWEFVVFCNVEDGLPFTVLLVVVEGRLKILSMYYLYAASLCSVGWLDK